ncbi:MAG: tetratricopeptide repeat protein, partial [Spirochaetales bacterium]|nr:tetratricopeptide repeat protein [Spirochaetales bacterium]
RDTEAAAYLAESLRWSSGDADAVYAAASMYAEKGDYAEAARLAKTALGSRPSHSAALSLLASIYYDQGHYDDARSVLERALDYNRSDARAWFLLGLVESASGRFDEARYALSTVVDLRPDDELARIALENLVMDGTSFEDSERAALAAWRFERAADLEDRLLYEKALAEYRRGLAIDPYANRGRRRYAELLRGSGLPGSYLAELKFLSDLGKDDKALKDAIEIYNSVLAGSVSRAWSLKGFPADSVAYRVAVFSTGAGGDSYHAGGDVVVARYLRDILAFEPGLVVDRAVPRVASFSDAFRLARDSGADWFVLVGVAETERDVVASAELRAARTGALALRIEAPRSGNDRVALSVAKIVSEISSFMPLRGSILARKADTALVDLGRVDGIAPDDAFLVIKNGAVSIKPDGSGLEWRDADVVARLILSRVDDEVAEGTLRRTGFFDRVNPRDIIIREPPKAALPEQDDAKAPTTEPSVSVREPSYLWSAL